jgi:hypothetical protein
MLWISELALLDLDGSPDSVDNFRLDARTATGGAAAVILYPRVVGKPRGWETNERVLIARSDSQIKRLSFKNGDSAERKGFALSGDCIDFITQGNILGAAFALILFILLLTRYIAIRMKTKITKRRSAQAHRPRRKIDDPAQYERFRKAARELETDESKEAFERAFRRVISFKDSLS